MVTTFRVTDWLKPTHGPERAKIETADIAADGMYERWRPGTRLFVAIDVDPTVLPNWSRDLRRAAPYRRAIPDARSLTCPYGPS